MSESNNNKNDRIVSHLTRNTIALIWRVVVAQD